MTWRTLLVPHDFSACADRALGLAAQLAAKHGAQLALLHVTHLSRGMTADAMITDRESGELVRVDAYARAQATRELEQRAAAVRATGVEVEVRHAMGDVVQEILRSGADLIVIGTHGRSGLAALVLGSVAERVVRHAAVPVLTVREKADPLRTTGEMVVTDLATD